MVLRDAVGYRRAMVVDRLAADAVIAGLAPPLTDNVDPERFPDGMAAHAPEEAAARLGHLREHAADLEWLDSVLHNDASRRLLHDKLLFHVLGHTRARVGPSVPEVRELLAIADEQLIVRRDVTPAAPRGQRRQPPLRPRAARLPDRA